MFKSGFTVIAMLLCILFTAEAFAEDFKDTKAGLTVITATVKRDGTFIIAVTEEKDVVLYRAFVAGCGNTDGTIVVFGEKPLVEIWAAGVDTPLSATVRFVCNKILKGA
jgi:hypothetical protein